ncbi:hypothetical protein [Streptomyces sp. NL15-2K]|uniref:hypothetical protein n=1 Tax=Streptomyces sp. NL15-2K TaxID=376149 RepID=UPI000F561854|nr:MULTISPECIES: hypothetical protein [Actinomycetes]WKX13018.1 hypothetical protein Q4V64_38045 [Kutzneria buriramensis]
MTIEVYRINPVTGVRTQVRAKRTVKPAEVPEVRQTYPACSCPRCVDAAIRLRAQLTEANRRSRGEL